MIAFFVVLSIAHAFVADKDTRQILSYVCLGMAGMQIGYPLLWVAISAQRFRRLFFCECMSDVLLSDTAYINCNS
jgi:hypothetical protein